MTSANEQDDQDEQALAIARAAFGYARNGEVVKLADAIALGLPVDVQNEKGDSLLMVASYNGKLQAVRLLLDRHADPELKNDRGQSPLAGAAFKGDVEMTRLLLSRGARVDAATPDGKTALMFAAMFDRSDVIDVLLEHGASK